MNATQIGNNIIAYSLQIGLLVGVGASLPTLLRLKAPHARLLYWQLLLLACLALPWVRPWHEEVVTIGGTEDAVQVSMRTGTSTPVRHTIPPVSEIALWLLAAGVVTRLSWLAAGVLKLRRYRRHGIPFPLPSGWMGTAGRTRLLVSDEVTGPVTFGFLRPVVLLPPAFTSMSREMQDAILFHELLHVERRDWLFTVGEEVVRAAFWFHPAVWWVLGEIQLSREQTVDQTVVAMTQSRDRYVDTLLAMAGVNAQMDLAPAPLFLRRRHLKQRVIGVIQEARMSKTHLIIAETAAVTVMAAAGWFITGAVSLSAAPQMVTDSLGVSVNLNGSQLMHRSPVAYPADALAKGVEGTVVVQVKLNADGEVGDANVLSGPDALRRSALQSVLTWHFDKSEALTTRLVNIDFVKPATPVVVTPTVTTSAAVVAPTAVFTPEIGGGRGGAGVRSPQLGTTKATIRAIDVIGLSDAAKSQLLGLLPVHVGDTFSPETFPQVMQAVHGFDEHLMVSANASSSSEETLRIVAQQAPLSVPVPITGSAGPLVRVGSNVQQANLISSMKPIYPPLAKQARMQGVVRFDATIGKDGTIQDLKVVSGPPLLIAAAMQAVKQWVYKPTLLNGEPVEVATSIDISFTLADLPPDPSAQ
jgi:TonB family protein